IARSMGAPSGSWWLDTLNEPGANGNHAMNSASVVAALILSIAMGSVPVLAATQAAGGTGVVCADVLANKKAYSAGHVRMCQSAEGVSPTYHRGDFQHRGNLERERPAETR